MKRVLHLLSGLAIGGKERVVLDLAARARRRGHDHQLVLFDTGFRRKELDLDPGDVPVHVVRRAPGLDWRLPGRVAELCAALGADVLHAHNDTALAYAGLATLLLRASAPALVGTFHSYPGHDTRGARALTRWAAGRAACVTAVSREVGERLVARGWIELYRTLGNGVDVDVYGPTGPNGGWRGLLGVPDDGLLVGHVGRFVPIKRQLDLLEAAVRLEGSPSRPSFLFVGRGPTLAEFRARARGRAHVHHVAHVPDVAALLRELDVFVQCSEHEASPRVLLEAMACARPCVASAVGGIPELARTAGEPCLDLVPPARPDLLAAAIERLGLDPLRRRRLAQRARRKAEDLDAEEGWNGYRRIYELARAA